MEQFDRAGTEPDLVTLLDDPLIQILMAYDRVTRDDLWALIHGVRQRLGPDPQDMDAPLLTTDRLSSPTRGSRGDAYFFLRCA